MQYSVDRRSEGRGPTTTSGIFNNPEVSVAKPTYRRTGGIYPSSEFSYRLSEKILLGIFLLGIITTFKDSLILGPEAINQVVTEGIGSFIPLGIFALSRAFRPQRH